MRELRSRFLTTLGLAVLATSVLAATSTASTKETHSEAASPAAAPAQAAATSAGGALGATVGKGDCKGQPVFTPGETEGYFIWHDDTGWHIRWTNKKKKPIFSGTITSNAAFGKVKAINTEGADFVKQVSENTIKIDAKGTKDVDGADFHPSASASTITFDLKIDGATADPHDVRLGAKKNRPAKVPFTVDLAAGKTEKSSKKTK